MRRVRGRIRASSGVEETCVSWRGRKYVQEKGLNDDEKRRRRTDSSRGNVLVPYGVLYTIQYIQVHTSTYKYIKVLTVAVRASTYQYVQ